MTDKLNLENLENKAKAAYKNGNFQEAQKYFQDAADSYQAIGEILNAAEMQNNRSVALLNLGDAKTALDVVIGTDDIFSEAGDKYRQAMAIGNKAAALDELGCLEDAAKYYEISADILNEIGEKNLRASVMQSLSAVQLKQGRRFEAIASMQAGLNGVTNPNPKQRVVKKLLQIPFNLLNHK
jgi:tetratricopeptide (TPR) repeat protein